MRIIDRDYTDMLKERGIHKKILATMLALTVAFTMLLTGALASAKASNIKITASKTWTVDEGQELLKYEKKFAYNKGKLISDKELTYRYFESDDEYTVDKKFSTVNKYKYKKGRLSSVRTSDDFWKKTTKDIYNYVEKSRKISKIKHYALNKKTGLFKLKSVTVYTRKPGKVIQTERDPKGKFINKNIVFYNAKRQKIKEDFYYQYDDEIDSYGVYKYYKSGQLKMEEHGSEYGNHITKYNKNGLPIYEESNDYDYEGEEGRDSYTFKYSDFYEGNKKYPGKIEKYKDGELKEKEERTYDRV